MAAMLRNLANWFSARNWPIRCRGVRSERSAAVRPAETGRARAVARMRTSWSVCLCLVACEASESASGVPVAEPAAIGGGPAARAVLSVPVGGSPAVAGSRVTGPHPVERGSGFGPTRDPAGAEETASGPVLPSPGQEGRRSQRRDPSVPPRGRAEVDVGTLCSRGYDELVVDLFCSGEVVRVPSLGALQEALGIVPERFDTTGAFALTGHSTALSARGVSSVNPRIIFHRSAHQEQELLALGFARGEQAAEMVVRDRSSGELRFYLLRYQQPCNQAAGGCNAGHLLTPAAERGWRNLVLQDDEDLKNSTMDCLHCHQPGGPGTVKMLRMQERDKPWTHWFDVSMPGGRALLDDYFAMKGDEPFAGVSAQRIALTNAALMEGFVLQGGVPQPNEFVGAPIEAEVASSAASEGGMQPVDNSVPGRSSTWQAIYDTAKRGEAISVPYHDVKVTDVAKLANVTEAYQRYRRGELSGDELPDFREVYPDDPQTLAEMGFVTEPGLDASGVLLQACGQCHNRRLDQSISRAHFVADMAALDTSQKARALERIQLPLDDPRVMPPARFRRLTDEAKKRLIDAFR